jgi:integrase
MDSVEVQESSTPNVSLSGKPRRCPECGSERLNKAGFRKLVDGALVQRYICKGCGYRFSEVPLPGMPVQQIKRGCLKAQSDILEGRQISVTLARGAKNLAEEETRHEKPTRGGTTLTGDAKGLITQFMAWCEAEGYPHDNCYHKFLRRLVTLGADLRDPKSVKETIGKHKCKDGSKLLFVYAYEAFTRMMKIEWDPPKYKQEETLPFVPEESELEALISACHSKRMTAFLQCLKETYADPGEVLQLRWIDISGNIVTINKPVKGHLPGQLPVSNKLLAMLNCLPKTSERIFPARYQNILTSYWKVRKRAAQLQHNPRLLAVQFRSFRHWGGSMIAHYTNGNVLTVKKLLRHKRIENTMKYISMIHFKDDEFEVATATTIEEAKQVVSAGFDYVAQKDGVMLFRKPKRFL